jgi:succinate dehydrogenase / fumarate reductase cytochrome b subunit
MAQQTVGDTTVARRRPQAAQRRQGVWSTNPAVALWGTMVGQKVVMAVTGVILVGFVIGHMLGNLKIFMGPEAINHYARFLREVGEPLVPYEFLLWVARIILLVCVGLHIMAAVGLTRVNWAARPQGYDTKRSLAATYASLTMRATGVLLVVFIIYHLLHMTAGVVGFQPGQFHHLSVYKNALAGFSVWYVTLFYVLAMAALCLHLDHGIWSMLQTLGLNNARATPALRAVSRVLAIILFAGFCAVPIAVFAGWLG